MNMLSTTKLSPQLRTTDDRTVNQLTKNGEEQFKAKKKNQQRLYTRNEQLVQQFLSSLPVSVLIICLVGLYALLIFIIVALQDNLSTDQFNSISDTLSYIELSILSVFLVEIGLNVYAYSLRRYYGDSWLILDTLIIVASLVLVIVEVTTDGVFNSNIIKIIQVVFRVLRIFLLIRKAQQFKKISFIQKIDTPAEKITRLLTDLKDLTEQQDQKLDLEYCIEKISNNQLYEFGQMGEDDLEMVGWMAGSIHGRQEVQRVSIQRQKKQTNNMHLLKIPKKVLDIFLAKHDDLYIDPFECDKLSTEEGLMHLSLYLFEHYDLFDVYQVKLKTMRAYFHKIMEGYLNNMYHNRIHAFDVLQTSNFLLSKCKMIEIAALDEQDISCIFIAAAAHDYGHPGVTNAYLINSKSQLALTYNDQSVLEMYHASSAFTIAWNNEKCNIFDNLSFQKYRKIRESIVSIVLSTDMAYHQQELAQTNARIASQDFDPKGKDKQRLMDLIVHSSDISNPIKSFDIYKLWTERVLGEFWLQGDREKSEKLPVSYLCNRLTTNTAEAQMGFIDYIVKPTYTCILSFLPAFEPYYVNLDKNRAKWAELVEYYKAQLRLCFVDVHEALQKQVIMKEISGISKVHLIKTGQTYNLEYSTIDQEQMFFQMGDTINAFINGSSCDIVVYGGQGSGKSYTLFGTNGSMFSLKQHILSPESGLVIRTIQFLIQRNVQFQLRVQQIENEKMSQLLVVEDAVHSNKNAWSELSRIISETVKLENKNHLIIEFETSKSLLRFVSVSPNGKALFTLNRCIQAILSHSTYIPFRDCKITKLLQDSLLSKKILRFIPCVSPTNFEETLITLQLASIGSLLQRIETQEKSQPHTHGDNLGLSQMLGHSQKLGPNLNDYISIAEHNLKLREQAEQYEAIIQYLQEKLMKRM